MSALRKVRLRPRSISSLVLSTLAAFVAIAALVPVPSQALTPTAFDASMWGTDGRVRAIVQTADAIYLGGDFDNLISPTGETVPRANFAALDPTTGGPLPLTADTRGTVFGLALSPDEHTLFLAGEFSQITGIARSRAGAIDTTTGQVLSFSPVVGGRVRAIATSGSTVYLGGDFTTLGGAARSRLAAVTASTGALIPAWTGTANDRVHTIMTSIDGARVYVGGAFTMIAGSAQANLAILDANTGKPQSYSPHPSDPVIDLAIANNRLFTVTHGNFVAARDSTTGARLWNAETNGDGQAITVQNGVLYIGGHFTEYNGAVAKHLVAADPVTGARLDWKVNLNSVLGVFELNSFQGHLAVGGDFTKVNGRPSLHFARFTEQ